MRQPIQVLVIAHRETGRGREYLLLHRIPSKWCFWQPVSGGVEDDENLITAARRELTEETGYAAGIVTPIDFTYYIPSFHDRQLDTDDREQRLPVHVFAAAINDPGDPRIDPAEHDDFRWCPLDLARRLLYWPSDREALRRCEAFLDALG